MLTLLRQIEDSLFPALKLDVWERVAYWHLFVRTRAVGQDSVVLGVDPLATSTGISTTKLRETIRSMADKGCIAIDDRSRSGHSLRVLLPHEIPGLVVDPSESAKIDIETLDFFSGRQFLGSLMQRERNRCFYCLAAVSAETAVLDHCVAQVNGGDNSYRNIVVSCHTCNARKQAMSPDDFLRLLYRNGVLSVSDLKDRLDGLSQLQAGRMVPAPWDRIGDVPK
ncbi:MAG: HNH endonuclease [Nitrospirota bacterium]